MRRAETRAERYGKKLKNAITLPASFVTVNFHCDENLAFLIRTAACFGVRDIHVIGSIPPRRELKNPSGSLIDYVRLYQYSNPSSFLAYSRAHDFDLVSAEIAEGSVSLYAHAFNFDKTTAIILGNESTGIPVELMFNSRVVHIPMIGVGFCLNTSQTGTAFLSEYSRQYSIRNSS